MESLEQTLRAILTPITHNLPGPIQQTATQLLGDSCYRSLVHNINLSDTQCLKLAISKALGIGIISASSIVKIPQLLKLLNSQSAEGISFLSYLLETTSYLISLAYNVRNQFPFSTYGEVALIAIQNVAISVLVLQFSGKGPAAAVFVAGLAGAGYALYSESVTSMGMLQYLQAGAGLLGVASKLPQIVTIFQEGGTGQLSAFAVCYHQTLSSCYLSYLWMLTFLAGLQLPRRLPQPHLHHAARSARPAHPLRLHRSLRAQRRSRGSDGLVLERSREQEHGDEEAE